MVEWNRANDVISEFEKQHLKEFFLNFDHKVVLEILRERSRDCGIAGKNCISFGGGKDYAFQKPLAKAIKVQKSYFD
ncbi:hypothetical protein KL927_004019 [Ogataea polymorpha]|nr:hypothetical protein KL927_004019 [Ogataea polymorpha]